jgi:hypothetical protein
MMLEAQYLSEPDLVFGNQGEEKDPRLGMRKFGPYFSPGEGAPSPARIRLGLIGTGETIGWGEKVIGRLREPVSSSHTNKWLYPDYDGFSLDTPARCEFSIVDTPDGLILPQETKEVLSFADANLRIAAAANLLATKVERFLMEDSPPEVLLIALPPDIEEYCGIGDRTRGAKRPSFTDQEKLLAEFRESGQRFLEEWGLEVTGGPEPPPEKDFDLRNALKGKVMRMKQAVPVQILRSEPAHKFLTGSGVEDGSLIPAHFAWNLATGLYYKAKGRPWRLAKLPAGTCYIGVSFFQDLRSPDQRLQTSMAQVFTHSGDGFVLRGSEVMVDEGSKEAHLSERQARELLSGVLLKYREKASADAHRIVIHKTSGFSPDEAKGFLSEIGGRPYDLVSFHVDDPVRLLRYGDFPVLRGTLVSLSNEDHLLYTTGYIPRVRAYPGVRVPEPLHIRHTGSSPIRAVAEEILGLTKLNWNTTSFATRRPITLEFAKQVGKVLSELEPGAEVQDHYRFYM